MTISINRSQLVVVIGISMMVISVLGILFLWLVHEQKLDEARSFVSAGNIEERGSAESEKYIAYSKDRSIKGENITKVDTERTVRFDGRTLPPRDPTLPDENLVLINKLGVEAMIGRSGEPDVSLRSGAWMPDDFNTPPGNAIVEGAAPVILASHLYGYDFWSEDFRKKVSFRGLEKLEVGDEIEIIWDQRRYVYKVKGSEVNTEISSYENDLIIYTCNDLAGSDLRVIQYADLVEDLI